MSEEITEIYDLQTNSMITLSGNPAEKDLVIEDLNKKLRYNKFENEKMINSLQSEIENYKQKLENMSKDQNNKSYQQITIELEANISRLEGELLEYKEVEADLKKTIINFAAETFDLKNQITQFQNDTEELDQLRGLRDNLSEFQQQVKESAIETIIEKDKELESINQKLAETEIYYETQIETLTNEIQLLQQQTTYKRSSFLTNELFNNNANNTNEEELEKIAKQFEKERFELNERIQLLSNELEMQNYEFAKQKEILELELNEKVHQKLNEQIQAASSMENNLLEELQKYDDNLRSHENTIKDLEKLNKSLESKHSKTIAGLKSRVEELEKNLQSKELEFKKFERLETKRAEDQESFQKIAQEHANSIKTLEKQKDKDRERIIKLEGENKKFSQNIEKLQEAKKNLEIIQNESEERINSLLCEVDDLKNKLNEQKNVEEETAAPLISMEILPHLKNLPTRSEAKLPNNLTLSSELTVLSEKTTINVSAHDSNKTNSNQPRRSIAPRSSKLEFLKPFEFESFHKSSFLACSGEENLQKRINQLENENEILKKEISSLKNNLLDEVDKSKKKQVFQTQEQQSIRRQSLLGLQLIPENILEKLNEEGIISNGVLTLENFEKAFRRLEEVNNAKKEIELKYNTSKNEYEHEREFLKQELKHAEQMAIDAKLQYAITATEKDYFAHEFKTIIGELKRKNIEIEYQGEKRKPKFFDIFLCACK